eukprot:4168952-Pleurochrysis_carterae.AAC.1
MTLSIFARSPELPLAGRFLGNPNTCMNYQLLFAPLRPRAVLLGAHHSLSKSTRLCARYNSKSCGWRYDWSEEESRKNLLSACRFCCDHALSASARADASLLCSPDLPALDTHKLAACACRNAHDRSLLAHALQDRAGAIRP